jgi:glutamate-1-semialdehyde 2,1-aminomutase
MYPDQNSRSAGLYKQACRVMPGGNTRSTLFHDPYPIYAASGSGSRILDVDGIEYLDFINNSTTLIHGHAHPAVVDAVTKQVQKGTSFSLPTEAEVQLAELLSSRVPSIEHIRFTNSGTEAVMMAIKAARAYTGRPKIAKVEGAYHGSYDYAQISLSSSPENWGEDIPIAVPASRGTPQGVLNDVIILPFNDTEKARQILASCSSQLAGVLIDPIPHRVGLIPASHEYLSMLRDVTRRSGAILIFDEVICFRLGYGGVQGKLGITPDLTTFGKAIGGGFPIGAVGGNAAIMSVFDPSRGKPAVPHDGTFNANPVTMAAGLAAMELMTPEVYDRLDRLGERVRSDLNEAFALSDQPGQVTGVGSLFKIHMTKTQITDYRSAYPSQDQKRRFDDLYQYLLNHGVLIAGLGLGALSTVMTDQDLEYLQQTVLAGLRQMKKAASGL